ncbi:hypothetical protein [Sandaracinus amylolyticus]|uniref:Uncharacterized protein n=1 Tax=Sandaracinus amylolyticus TaxID=927083 RepID=A0A0F6SG00_9BACT|nr:hypothetical protein [Sandaracinus amylolyticus]AKF07829.1 hypothetical protein DB32_004978 [Sandaracinus amylolyticus]
MGVFVLRFAFELEAPSFDDVERAFRAEIGRGLTHVEPGARHGASPTFRIRDAEGFVLVEQRGGEWVLHADMHRSGPLPLAQDVLRALGGHHPPRSAGTPQQRDFGEEWYGWLFEGGDVQMRTATHAVRVWHGFLSRLEELARTDLVSMLEARDVAAFERALSAIPPEALADGPFADALPRVHAELLTFLAGARASHLLVDVQLDA